MIALLLIFNLLQIEVSNASLRKSIYELSDEENLSAAANTSSCIVKYFLSYFDANQSAQRTIYLVVGNNSNDSNSIEDHLLMKLHETNSQSLSIPAFILTEFADFSLLESSLVSERRDFVFFHNADRAIDGLIVD